MDGNYSAEEYAKASQRLIEKALGSGDAQMLLDVKLLMDTVTEMQKYLPIQVSAPSKPEKED